MELASACSARATLAARCALLDPPRCRRRLLCDLWQPPRGVASSGLALVFLHGGAWYMLDKDFFTRPFFRHLAAQGHVVMDVAYRMYPETDAWHGGRCQAGHRLDEGAGTGVRGQSGAGRRGWRISRRVSRPAGCLHAEERVH